MLGYDFGPHHPLKPERLRRAVALVQALVPDLDTLDPGLAPVELVERVHTHDYVNAVHALSVGDYLPAGIRFTYGFSSLDNLPFPDMYEASLAYCAGSIWAAKAVVEGDPLAFCLAGGLHHAMAAKASGFCIFNDAAIACTVLRERFERVMYIDIDVHHGDGVQAIFIDDPNILTYSIHQDGRTLFPGTGALGETGTPGTSVNAPIAPKTTGDVWLDALRRTLIPTVERFRPQAIVLQLGTDTHFRDPLANLQVTAQEWFEAVAVVRDLGLPIVAVGGGGYELSVVPRLWAGAVMTLCKIEFDGQMPDCVPEEWHMPSLLDELTPEPRKVGFEDADKMVRQFESQVLPGIPAG
jgi:acetoin utilization protein AcuC